jgi:Transposase DDE domain group 1
MLLQVLRRLDRLRFPCRIIHSIWPNTRIVWRGDSHYGRVEAMDWAEDNDTDYIFGLAGNAALDAVVAEAADNLRFHHAMSSKAKLRTFASFLYQAGSWKRPRKVVARLECSLQPVAGETGMRQEVDIRYVVTSLKGSGQHLYENVYCRRGQMENLIKLHKAQLASDRIRLNVRFAAPNPIRFTGKPRGLQSFEAPCGLMRTGRGSIPPIGEHFHPEVRRPGGGLSLPQSYSGGLLRHQRRPRLRLYCRSRPGQCSPFQD